MSNARDGDEAPDENSSQRRSYIDYCGHAVSLSEGKGQLIKEGEKGPLRVESGIVHMAEGIPFLASDLGPWRSISVSEGT